MTRSQAESTTLPTVTQAWNMPGSTPAHSLPANNMATTSPAAAHTQGRAGGQAGRQAGGQAGRPQARSCPAPRRQPTGRRRTQQHQPHPCAQSSNFGIPQTKELIGSTQAPRKPIACPAIPGQRPSHLPGAEKLQLQCISENNTFKSPGKGRISTRDDDMAARTI